MPSNKMIGFAHVEWHWGSDCIYKWIGVRYSDDGIGWTTPVPIITREPMKPVGTCLAHTNVSTGDFAAAWDPSNQRWVILAQELGGPLVMSVSTDALATPGSWNRLNPRTGSTIPSLIGNGTTLAQPDLASVAGANPSIIRNTKNGKWHMVYKKWGGALYASTTADLNTWSAPKALDINGTEHPGIAYPSLIGDGGDLATSDGTAMLYFTDNKGSGGYKSIWAVPIDFNA